MVLQPFIFRLYVSFYLKWVSCRLKIDGSCFFIQSETLRLLMGSLSPFMFRVTIEKYEFCVIVISIQSLFLWIFFFELLSFSESPLIFLAELVWWSHILSVSVYLGSSLSLLLFWMRALLDKEFLAACSSHLRPWIYPASLFWPARSLWRGLLLI